MMGAGARPKALGLCQTCRCAEKCALPGRAEHGVQHCEEFEPCDEPGHVTHTPQPQALGNHAVISEGNSEVMGLCVDCLARSTCKLSKTAGGIWFCEEYE